MKLYGIALIFNVISFYLVLKDAIQLNAFTNPGLQITEFTVVIQGISIVLLVIAILNQMRIDRLKAIVNGHLNQPR